jgi:hypothetical protein
MNTNLLLHKPMIIILEQEYTLRTTGTRKPSGTELTFAKGSEEAAYILKNEIGYLKAQLPRELPGRSHFLAAGIESLQVLRDYADDWTQIKGIGPVTAQEIDQFFKEQQ